MFMICPVCRSDMLVVEYHRIELDYCPACRGVWFDAGELDLLLEATGVESPTVFRDNILASPEAESSEKRRRCPICGRRMKKTLIGEEPKVLIDFCDQGDGLWFDGGELEELLRQLTGAPPGGADAQKPVIAFLQEVFEAEGQTDRREAEGGI